MQVKNYLIYPSEIKFLSTSPFIGYYDNEGEEHNQMGETYFEVDG